MTSGRGSCGGVAGLNCGVGSLSWLGVVLSVARVAWLQEGTWGQTWQHHPLVEWLLAERPMLANHIVPVVR